jgi:hypothetical protein
MISNNLFNNNLFNNDFYNIKNKNNTSNINILKNVLYNSINIFKNNIVFENIIDLNSKYIKCSKYISYFKYYALRFNNSYKNIIYDIKYNWTIHNLNIKVLDFNNNNINNCIIIAINTIYEYDKLYFIYDYLIKNKKKKAYIWFIWCRENKKWVFYDNDGYIKIKKNVKDENNKNFNYCYKIKYNSKKQYIYSDFLWGYLNKKIKNNNISWFLLYNQDIGESIFYSIYTLQYCYDDNHYNKQEYSLFILWYKTYYDSELYKICQFEFKNQNINYNNIFDYVKQQNFLLTTYQVYLINYNLWLLFNDDIDKTKKIEIIIDKSVEWQNWLDWEVLKKKCNIIKKILSYIVLIIFTIFIILLCSTYVKKN